MSTAHATASRLGEKHAPKDADYQNIEDLPAYATVQQVAAFLNQSVSTVRYWVQTDYIPSVRLGKSRRFPREALREWLVQQEREGAAA